MQNEKSVMLKEVASQPGFVRDNIDATLAGLHAWATALLDLAEKSGDAVMPSYTHLQRAEPVLVAHWLQAYVQMLLRDISRHALVAPAPYKPFSEGMSKELGGDTYTDEYSFTIYSNN